MMASSSITSVLSSFRLPCWEFKFIHQCLLPPPAPKALRCSGGALEQCPCAQRGWPRLVLVIALCPHWHLMGHSVPPFCGHLTPDPGSEAPCMNSEATGLTGSFSHVVAPGRHRALAAGFAGGGVGAGSGLSASSWGSHSFGGTLSVLGLGA